MSAEALETLIESGATLDMPRIQRHLSNLEYSASIAYAKGDVLQGLTLEIKHEEISECLQAYY